VQAHGHRTRSYVKAGTKEGGQVEASWHFRDFGGRGMRAPGGRILEMIGTVDQGNISSIH
jgi:hypothetical protein